MNHDENWEICWHWDLLFTKKNNYGSHGTSNPVSCITERQVPCRYFLYRNLYTQANSNQSKALRFHPLSTVGSEVVMSWRINTKQGITKQPGSCRVGECLPQPVVWAGATPHPAESSSFSWRQALWQKKQNWKCTKSRNWFLLHMLYTICSMSTVMI